MTTLSKCSGHAPEYNNSVGVGIGINIDKNWKSVI